MKTIAVDIDEVLARHNHTLALFHNQRYGTRHTENDYITDHWSRVWQVSHEETERRVAEFHDSEAYASLEAVSGARDALEELRQRYNLVVVTVRRRRSVNLTEKWVEKHFPGIFRNIRFVHIWEDENTKTKADICQELGASWLIDDSIKHSIAMAQSGGNAILFGNYVWNQADLLPVGVERIENWPAVVEYFANDRS